MLSVIIQGVFLLTVIMLLVIILNKLSVVICAIILIAKMLGNIMQNVVTLGAIK
jgi:hypothetical protein